MSSERWTDERVGRLKLLVRQGLSGSQIALALRVSRNAVIGKVLRLGIGPLGGSAASAPKRVRVGVCGAAALAKAKALSGRPVPEPPRRLATNLPMSATRLAPMPPAPVSKPIDASAAKPWTERRFGECAYPVGGEKADTLSCCLPTDGRGYCAQHHAIMFVVPHTTPRSLMKLAGRYAA